MSEQITKPMSQALTARAGGGMKKVNYLEFDFFKAQLKTVKATFTDVQASNMFIKSNETLMKKGANISDLFQTAFGDSFIDEANKNQCLVGTFIDHSQPKIKGNRQKARAGSQMLLDIENSKDN